MNISGKVRIEVVIAPDGRVRSARVVGGHPVLVQSCLEAVKDWKYEPASEETTQIVEFEFKGNSSDPLGSARLLVGHPVGACCSLGEWRK